MAALVLGPAAGVTAGWCAGAHYAAAAPVGPRGPAGPPGLQGPQGPQGRAGFAAAYEGLGGEPDLSGAIVIARTGPIGCPDGTSAFLGPFPVELYPSYRLCEVD
ncbi:hypothetical protein ABN034_12445 [Actinopolymorpha sp. B11F2]